MSNFLYGGNVHANGIRQHYLRYGGARGAGRDPVIIVPGITSPAITWGFVGERFGESFDTYILDVRGRGLSEAGAALNYGLVAQAADVLAFAQALGLEQYSLVGHSMGGRIGVRAGRSKPAGLRRLVLADPPVSGPDAGRIRPSCPGTWTPWRRRARAWTPKPCARSAPAGPMRSASCAPSGCIPATSAPSSRASMTSITTTSMRTCRCWTRRSC